jgi:hypothetical protein
VFDDMGEILVDAAFVATVDPATLLFTSAACEDPLVEAAPQFLSNELGGRDVNRFTDLAAARSRCGRWTRPPGATGIKAPGTQRLCGRWASATS